MICRTMDAEKKQKLRDRAENIINSLPYSIEEIAIQGGFQELNDWIDSRKEERAYTEAHVGSRTITQIITEGTAEDRAWLILKDYDYKLHNFHLLLTEEQRHKCAAMPDKVETAAIMHYFKLFTDIDKMRLSLERTIKDYEIAIGSLAVPLAKLDMIKKYNGATAESEAYIQQARGHYALCAKLLVKVKTHISAINHYLSTYKYGSFAPMDLAITIKEVESEKHSRAIILPEHHLSEYAKKDREQKLEDGVAFVPCYKDIKIDKDIEKKFTERIKQRRLQHGMSL